MQIDRYIPKKVLLESEIGEFALFDEFHGQLTQSIDGKEGNILITAGADYSSDLREHTKYATIVNGYVPCCSRKYRQFSAN